MSCCGLPCELLWLPCALLCGGFVVLCVPLCLGWCLSVAPGEVWSPAPLKNIPQKRRLAVATKILKLCAEKLGPGTVGGDSGQKGTKQRAKHRKSREGIGLPPIAGKQLVKGTTIMHECALIWPRKSLNNGNHAPEFWNHRAHQFCSQTRGGL